MRTALTALALVAMAHAEGTAPLSGEWRLRLDGGDVGITEQWFNSGAFPNRIHLPGSTDEYGFGARNEKREPGRLTRKFEYVGPAWYQREVTIPDQWKGKRITLFLERCHWESQAWLDGRPLGLQNSLSTPHVFELGSAVAPGVHRLTLRVDNRLRIDVGRAFASAVNEEGPSNWNGVTGRMELRATDGIWIGSVSVYPDRVRRRAGVRIQVRNTIGETRAALLKLVAGPIQVSKQFEVPDRPVTILDVDLPLGDSPRLWGEFSPSLYDLAVSLTAGDLSDEVRTRFGMREVSASGRRIEINGKTVFARGTVDNGAFPRKGYPSTDIETWRSRFQTYRDYGINHVRFHSWCPPEAAFAAADELGLTLQVENPMWIGDGRVSADAARTAFIRQEAEAIVDTYGNHPSFCFMSMGNELGSGLDPFIGELVRSLRSRDPRRLYTSTSAPDDMRRPDDYFVSAGPRWQNLRGDPRLENKPPNTDFDYREYLAKMDRPVIAHELGQWTVFPDFGEARKYDGPQQPRFLDIYRESLERNQLFGQAEEFRKASGALMVELYKEEIESILRTPSTAGFQLLGLSDWPGFGPALIGVLDTLGDSKGLITPQAFRRFCGPTVPLLRLKKRAWTTDETLAGAAELSHFGTGEMKDISASWTVRDSTGASMASGRFAPANIDSGRVTALGEIGVPLTRFPAPARYSIEVSAGDFSNDWTVWVYPRKPSPGTAGVVIATGWDAAARAALQQGRTVVLLLDPKNAGGTTPVSFTTSFWSLLWFPKRHQTMGILCDPKHPALRQFPTASHSDWQWWDLMSQSRAFVLNGAPPGFRPVVQVIDDPNRNYRLGGVFEARVANGKLLAASFDLDSALDSRLAARQLRHSLLNYAGSREFQPADTLDVEFLNKVFSWKEQ